VKLSTGLIIIKQGTGLSKAEIEKQKNMMKSLQNLSY